MNQDTPNTHAPQDGTPPNRRRFLRGLGTALALPLLPSALPRSAWAAAAKAQAAPPTRLAFLFVPNGANMEQWTPQGEGADFKWSPTLAPLDPLRKHVQVLSGLAHDTAWSHGDGPGDHARNASTFLTGVHPEKTAGAGIRAGISVDQLAARHFAEQTKFQSLELGIEPGTNAGNCDSGYSCAYTQNISWRTPHSPATKEINPRLLFDRLFAGGSVQEQATSQARRAAERSSLLDLVQSDARSLRKNLAGDDQRKLDEYLEGVRSIERHLQHDSEQQQEAHPLIAEDGQLRRPAGIPRNYQTHLRQMADLLVLAFQADLTRVSSLMLGRAGSQITYKNIGIRQGHHTLSHHKHDPDVLDQIAKINRYHVEQLAYFLGKLNSIDTGNGSLLDHTLVAYGSGISDGNRHAHNDLPIVFAGGQKSGKLTGGVHRRFPQDTPLMNLYLTMLQTAGVPVEQMGDSTSPLPLG